MAENAKSDADQAGESQKIAKKGRAKELSEKNKAEQVDSEDVAGETTDTEEKTVAKTEESATSEDKSQKTEESENENNANTSDEESEDEVDDSQNDAEPEETKLDDSYDETTETKAEENNGLSEETTELIREQIENCKNELEIALAEKIRHEFEKGAFAEIKKANRRRRIGNVMHDIVIAILIAIAVYFGYCLYDVRYFDFMKTPCERDGTCETPKDDKDESENNPTKDVLKDTNWYIENYGYLFDNLRTELNADNIDAYYFYSGDYKVGDLKSSHLLSMAYNRAQSDFDTASATLTIPGSSMRNAFTEMFGGLTYYVPGKFMHGCQKFTFQRDLDNFAAKYDADCAEEKGRREIAEVITEMREEGNVLYVFTTAAIFDQTENSFYSFDDLFHPAVMGVEKDDLKKYSGILNSYQYQFKKTEQTYFFDGIVKLR